MCLCVRACKCACACARAYASASASASAREGWSESQRASDGQAEPPAPAGPQRFPIGDANGFLTARYLPTGGPAGASPWDRQLALARAFAAAAAELEGHLAGRGLMGRVEGHLGGIPMQVLGEGARRGGGGETLNGLRALRMK